MYHVQYVRHVRHVQYVQIVRYVQNVRHTQCVKYVRVYVCNTKCTENIQNHIDKYYQLVTKRGHLLTKWFLSSKQRCACVKPVQLKGGLGGADTNEMQLCCIMPYWY